MSGDRVVFGTLSRLLGPGPATSSVGFMVQARQVVLDLRIGSLNHIPANGPLQSVLQDPIAAWVIVSSELLGAYTAPYGPFDETMTIEKTNDLRLLYLSLGSAHLFPSLVGPYLRITWV